jgi:ParB family chromosome partitioning protein
MRPVLEPGLRKKGLLESYDEMLGLPAEDEQKIVQLPCYKLIIDENQPFRLYTEEQLQDLAERIKRSGLLNPVIVRPSEESKYEVLSGRNRVKAVMLNGEQEIQAIVRDVDDDTAALIMIDANLGQRDILYPSEKAWAYKMEVEILNRKGQRTDLTLLHGGAKLDAHQMVGERHSESKSSISRYVRLTYLIPELLELVDDKELQFTIGVELSHLDEQSQRLLFKKYIRKDIKPDKMQVSELKTLFKDGNLNEQTISGIMEKEKEVKPPTVIKFNRNNFSEFSDIIDNEDKLETLFIEFLRAYRSRQTQN